MGILNLNTLRKAQCQDICVFNRVEFNKELNVGRQSFSFYYYTPGQKKEEEGPSQAKPKAAKYLVVF